MRLDPEHRANLYDMNNQTQAAAAQTPQRTFADLGIAGNVLQIIQQRKITIPTPIQEQSIPVVLQGSDVIGIAQTGTGKTLAFLLPIFQRLLTQPTRGQVLILVPTRELAAQVEEVVRWFSHVTRLYSAVIVGGASMYKQVNELKRNPQFIVATPGRLIDHLEQRTVNLSQTKYLVLDEADRMFDMGFAPQIKKIMQHLPAVKDRQTVLFSATMPSEISALVNQYMQSPVRVEIAASGSTAAGVAQEMIIIDAAHQQQALLSIIKPIKETILIFTRTKHRAKKLTITLRKMGYKAEELHSNLSLAQRKRSVAAIQSKKSQILIATDIAARGIDISHIELVINYDLPDNPEDYVHRIGRTGRAGRLGKAISFVMSDQAYDIRRIQKLIDVQIQQVHLDDIPSAQLKAGSSAPSSGYRGRGGSRGGQRRGGFGGGFKGGFRGRRSGGPSRGQGGSRGGFQRSQ